MAKNFESETRFVSWVISCDDVLVVVTCETESVVVVSYIGSSLGKSRLSKLPLASITSSFSLMLSLIVLNLLNNSLMHFINLLNIT